MFDSFSQEKLQEKLTKTVVTEWKAVLGNKVQGRGSSNHTRWEELSKNYGTNVGDVAITPTLFDLFIDKLED